MFSIGTPLLRWIGIGVRDNHESPSIIRITRAKDEFRYRKLGSKISLANSMILSIKIWTYG